MKEFTLPSPSQLVRRTKEETTIFSLRVKERTLAFFNAQAKEYNTTASVLINGLLDNYAEIYGPTSRQAEELNVEILRKYMKNVAIKIGKLSDEDIIINRLYSSMLMPLCESYNSGEEVNTDFLGGEDSYLRIDSDNNDDMMSNINLGCEIKEKADFMPEESWFYVDIPHDKWPVVADIIVSFLRKYKVIYNDGFHFSETKVKELVELINNYDDRVELAKKLAEFLVGYVEEVSNE